MITGKNILVLSTADWDTPLWTNKQHVAKRLAEGNRVLYVESLGMRRPRFTFGDLKRVFSRLRRITGRRTRMPVPANLEVLSPTVLPFWGNALVWRWNTARLASWINASVKARGIESYTLWTYTPFASLLLERLDPKPEKIVYHCVDNLSAFPGIPGELTRVSEESLCRRADVVFFTSKQMCDQKREMCRQAVHVGNVAEFSAPKPLRDERRGLGALPRPWVGFVGAIDSAKLDWPILEHLAGPKFPGSLILVGPRAATEPAARLEALCRSPKVLWLDGRTQAEAMAWMDRCDVLAIPYAINEYTRYVFPMKLFEYLGLGKPVVATPMPEVLPFSDWVSVAATPERFALAVQQDFEADNDELRDSRRKLAARHTWEQLLETMSDHLAPPLVHREGSGGRAV